MNAPSKSVDSYINQFPANIQVILNRIRKVIISTAPDVLEVISYGMPAYKINNRPLVYFAGYKNHIGFYATPSGHSAFKQQLSKYPGGKGSVQFPLDREIPFDLIGEIVKFRYEEYTSTK